MEVHTSLLIFNSSVCLLFHCYVSLTLKDSVPGYGNSVLFCMHFNHIPYQIKETKNNALYFCLYHLFLSCRHILYELTLKQNTVVIRCFFCARMQDDLITTDWSAERANFCINCLFNSIQVFRALQLVEFWPVHSCKFKRQLTFTFIFILWYLRLQRSGRSYGKLYFLYVL